MTKRTKAWIIAGSVIGGLALAFGGFIIFASVSPYSPFVPRGGELITIDAKKIGKTAKLEEKKVKIKGHEFTYYNVKSDEKGNWVLVDKSSYIINTDMQFGFRYKNVGTKITSYGDVDEPRDMGAYYKDETYHSYQVFSGFKITIDDALDLNNVNLGIFEHWC